MWKALLISFGAGAVGTGMGGVIGLLFGKRSAASVGGLLAFSGGVMLSVSFFDLIPTALELSGTLFTALSVLAGAVAVRLADAVVDFMGRHKREGGDAASVLNRGIIIFFAIALHDFPEGLAIGAGGAHNESFGLTVAVLMAAHNIPEGTSVCVPLIEGGVKPARAVLLSVLAGTPTLLGVVVGRLMGSASVALTAFSLALAAGAMISVTLGEILPHSTSLSGARKSSAFALLGALGGLLLEQSLAKLG